MLPFLLCIILTCAPAVAFAQVSYANDQRPFWTEQSSFTLGDTLYVIGVATKAASVEAGRQLAFTNGLEEIRNYSQLTNLENLLVETQRTFEEPQKDGTVSVWRLLQVPLHALRGIKGGARVVRGSGSKLPEVSQMAEPSSPSRQFTTSRVDKHRDRSVIVEKPTPTQKFPSVEVPLPAVPLHLTHVIKGWSRTSAGQLAIESEERRDWQVPLFNAADLSYDR